MDALVTFGTVFNSTGNFSLSSLFTIIYTLFLKPYLAPLKVNATFISQDPAFTPTPELIDAFLEEQFGEESSEWSCTFAVRLNRYNGPARNAFQVTLKHSSIPHESPLRELALRLLCAKLVGIHSVDECNIRILPAHVRGQINEVDKAFGSSLLLMHLKEFYNGQHRPRDHEWRALENDWMKYILEALGAFTDGYNTFSEFLTNEEIMNILEFSALIVDPRKLALGKLLLKVLEAYKNKSDKDMKACKKALRDFDMREKIELVRRSFRPVVAFRKDLNVILEKMDDRGSPDNEMEQLSKALLGVKACLVPFRGALGVVMTELSEQKNRYWTWGILSWAAYLPLFAFFWPLGVGAGAAFVYCGEKSTEKSRELGALSQLDEAGKDVDGMTACTRLYLALVILKAARFFNLESPEGGEYYSLMEKIFGIDPADEGFQINDYIKVAGRIICRHLQFLQQGVDDMSHHYGVKSSDSSTDW